MWISLLLALLAYLASPKGNDAERRRALLTAAGVGGAAYVATEYTDWGRDISNRFDGVIGVGGADGTAEDAANQPTVRSPNGSPSGGTSSFGNWIPGIVGAGIGATVVSGGVPRWVLLAGAGLAVYLILK